MARTKFNFYSIYNIYYKNLDYTTIYKPEIFIDLKFFYSFLCEGYFYFDISHYFIQNNFTLFQFYRTYELQKKYLDVML